MEIHINMAHLDLEHLVQITIIKVEIKTDSMTGGTIAVEDLTKRDVHDQHRSADTTIAALIVVVGGMEKQTARKGIKLRTEKLFSTKQCSQYLQ